jgi:hypothetical protein
MNQERIQKLEALLDRIRRNGSARRSRSATTAEPIALEALPATAAAQAAAPPPAPAAAKPATPAAPPVTFATTPPAHVDAVRASATPPGPPVAPPPVATPSWRPEPGSAVQARPTTVPPMELSEDDLIDVTTLPPGPEPDDAEAEPVLAVSAEEEEEQPPASSRRSRGPATLDEVMANASSADSEREIPVKTPPPESGPQEALPATGLEAPRLPDIENLEADLSGPPSMGPTAEQLGETIELEAPRGPELEIDITVSESDADVPAPAEELEVTLPRASLQSGLYDVSIAAPPSIDVPAPEVHVAVTVPAVASSPESPERVARPALGATDVAEVRFGTRAAEKSFLELLDSSLGL